MREAKRRVRRKARAGDKLGACQHERCMCTLHGVALLCCGRCRCVVMVRQRIGVGLVLRGCAACLDLLGLNAPHSLGFQVHLGK